MYILFFAISFLASVAGAICGIGGGIIIKPLLDSIGVLDVSAINFLSGCTVFSMSMVSIAQSFHSKDVKIKFPVAIPLVIGSSLGGMLGKSCFQMVKQLFAQENHVSLLQATLLMIITVITLVYTLKKDKVKTYSFTSIPVCILAGLFLGFLSVFLGIGGGPINLMILSLCFSMGIKEAALNSLFIIFVSQFTSLTQTLVSGTAPDVEYLLLGIMIGGGILGGVIGRRINKGIKEDVVQKLFIILMIVIIGINVFNMFKYAGM